MRALPVAKEPAVTRREALGLAAGAFFASLGLSAGCDVEAVEEALRPHFTRLTPAQIGELVARHEREYAAAYGKAVRVGATAARPGVVFGAALDIGKCIGCRSCVYACAAENNQSRDPQVHWIRVLETEAARSLDLAGADPYYTQAPKPGKVYLPVSCQHCEDAPCVKACPVSATWQEPDGIVVVDYDACIGCRYCMAACPYEARRFNWSAPGLPADEVNPDTHLLGNRPRPAGVVEKCTFCIQRVRDGRYPACVEACPVGARKFGDLLDPASEVRQVLATKHVFTLKSELGTRPRFFYYYGANARG
jgi:Fe-S-cluster-containing dehydrogenase component